LAEVAHGERVVLTKDGVPIAKLVPISEAKERSVKAVIEAWERYRDQCRLTLGSIPTSAS
jgi:antitoxin (DNA-binding transcriptional repressor) of toxin-antitoxin stability system